ncbi:MAG: hypothetical protein WD734_02675 [Dehalococcoidia bacterium]
MTTTTTTRTLPVVQQPRPHRGVRSDALPEHQEYRDEGCDLFASCLSCPLSRCRYDEPGGVRALLNRERDHQIRVLRDASDLTVDEIAARFLVSRRTVFRALHMRSAAAERASGGRSR